MPPKSNIKRVPRITMATNISPGRPGLRSAGPIDASLPAGSDAASTANTAPEDSFGDTSSKQNLQDNASKEDDTSSGIFASDAAADAGTATEDVQPPPIDDDASLAAADSNAASTARTAPEDSFGDTSSKQNLQDNTSKEDDTTAVESELDPTADSSVIGVEDTTGMDVEPTTKKDTTSTEKTKETSDNIPRDAPTEESNRNIADNSTNAKDVPSTPPQSKTAIDPPKSKEKEIESFITATTNNNPRVNVSYSMLPFLLLLDLDENDELTIGMPNVNWNVINMDVALELFLKMIGNPYQRKDGNQAKPMTHDMVLLMVQTDDKVSEPHYHRPMPLARTSIFREKIVKM